MYISRSFVLIKNTLEYDFKIGTYVSTAQEFKSTTS